MNIDNDKSNIINENNEEKHEIEGDEEFFDRF